MEVDGKLLIYEKLLNPTSTFLSIIELNILSGNSWGKNSGEKDGCLGCGQAQEEFYGCADIAIGHPEVTPAPHNK